MDDKEGDMLDLDPQKLQKRMPDINFDKQLGREDPPNIEDDEVYVNDLLDEAPIPHDPSVRKVVAHNFGLAGDRFDYDA